MEDGGDMSKEDKIAAEKAEEAFMAELTALTHKHGVKIGGCGCCGSPWLAATSNKTGRYSLDSDYSLQYEGQ